MRIEFDDAFIYKFKTRLKKILAFLLLTGGMAYAGYKSGSNTQNIGTEINIDVSGNDVDNSNIEDSISKEKTTKSIVVTSIGEEHILGNNLELNKPAVEDTRKVVAITFDDGPGKYTDRLLDILKENDAKATFFVLGKSAKRYSDSVKRAYDEGHEIGIHGYSHTYYTEMGASGTRREIVDTYNILREIDVEPSPMIRPPAMKYNNDLVQALDYEFILWSIDTRDWQSRDKEKIKQVIRDEIEEGSIILLHDIHECSVDAIEELLLELKDEYRFVTVSELFDILDNDLEINNVYKKAKVLKED